jgi:hypothetical protein
MNFENIFGERIKQLRTSQNLTQSQLGEAIGLSKQAINDIEKGRRLTTVDKALAIAQFFNTTVEYLCGVTENSNGIS